MTVFPDTNVWLSGIVFPGLCAELLARLFEGNHGTLTSELVKAEADEVLRRKFSRHAQALANLNLLWQQAECIRDAETPIDDADARLVKAAGDASADAFVTGDRHILDCGTRGAMRVVSPRDAWVLLFAPFDSLILD
ncbi:MAG: putative toxin-antitoxin system toxin component, PIN family [Nitrosospira sp.]|nr:putative toxin-antitoxin system toxin component, PIN family [Nitrosospira sp.]